MLEKSGLYGCCASTGVLFFTRIFWLESTACRKHCCIEEVSSVHTIVPDTFFVLLLVDAVIWSEFITQCIISMNGLIMPQTKTGNRKSGHCLLIWSGLLCCSQSWGWFWLSLWRLLLHFHSSFLCLVSLHKCPLQLTF